MPYDIKRNYGGCQGYAVVGPSGIKGCHSSRKDAIGQQRALYAAESQAKKSHDGVITNEDTPNRQPHSLEECTDKENCPDHMKVKKANTNWQEGMFVMGPTSEDIVHGKVEHVMRDGSLGPGSKYEVQATMEDPALLVRIYEEEDGSWEETELFVGVKSSQATLIGTQEDMNNHSMEKADSVRVGQMVSWNSSGGRAEGKVIRVIRNGKYNVPDSSFTITGTPEDPAVAIRLYRDGEPTDTIVGHKMKTLTIKKSMEDIDLEKASLEDLDLKPTESMASNARRGLELRRKFGRGGTAVGVARARDLANRKELSPDTVLRMYSFFSRHEVDKQGKDWNNSERPSNGKIAWLLWGGDSGYSWAKSKRNAIMRVRSQKSIWTNSPLSFDKNIDNHL